MSKEKFTSISLHHEMQRSYLEYAMSVIVGRALPDANDVFTVISKEYRINCFVYTVISDGLKLRSEMSLDTQLSIGDKCKVETIHGKNFLVLPENIKSYF